MKPAPNTIAVRAYVQKPKKPPVAQRKNPPRLDEPSALTLIFDTETTIDPGQALRIGAYQVRDGLDLIEEGMFFLPDTLTRAELATLTDYCAAKGLKLRTVRDFNLNVFMRVAYENNGLVAGFNLPFDLSRIALGYSEARDEMYGGFTYALTASRRYPNLRVKHLSRRAALISFAAPGRQETARSALKRDQKTQKHPGFFIDLKTLAAALTSEGFSLESLCAFLGVKTQKQAVETHGETLNEAYLDYARDDVQASWECLVALLARYREHGLDTPAHKILSEASIGKAYLNKMGIKPLLACQDVPREIFAIAMETYYGGRAETRIRRDPREVRNADFKSMYPTVNTLMGLWRYVIADGLTWRDATEETRRFLDQVTREDFQRPDTWRALTTLVRVKPCGDLLPVRACYDPSKAVSVYNIGLNFLTYDQPLWYTLADIIAAKILSGKAPQIMEAIRFEPGEPQMGLKPISLFGHPDFHIDPERDDAFKRFIDLRDAAKARGDASEKAIKIIANATSYGIFIEVLCNDTAKPEPIRLFMPDGDQYDLASTRIEEPGRFFHPVLGTLITGAARLMLALAERACLSEGLEWVFCDTDSLAMARPPAMSREAFEERVVRVIDWFEPLNPYEKPGSILQLEAHNFAIGAPGQLEPLYALAISAKRYALFNLDRDGQPVIRKASAHGLGHFMPPYGDDDPAPGLPEPAVPLEVMGVTRWQYDLWMMIIKSALGPTPHRLDLSYHPALSKPAASRYGATSPRLLKWMERWNAARNWFEEVRPFGFMVRFTGRSQIEAGFDDPEVIDVIKRGRPPKRRTLKPIAPFERDPAKAAAQAFDRETGEAIAPGDLKTYAEALRDYHLSPENKFENGNYFDRGETRRRHITALHIKRIGKEANAVGGEGLDYPAQKGDVAEFGQRDPSPLITDHDPEPDKV